jgi:hypothetical protein
MEVFMRLITRSDFDGLCCAALLREIGLVDEVLYAHPKDLQDRRIPVSANDILANVPFVDGCGMWFDHHSSEVERGALKGKFEGASEPMPSAARVIYSYYLTTHREALLRFAGMLDAVDKADAARYTPDDILNPRGWMMLAFIADPRTGLGYHHSYRISNFDLMKLLPDMLRRQTIEEILASQDFQERVEIYQRETEIYRQFILDHTQIRGNAIILDLRKCDAAPSGNRFIEYTLYPAQNISIRMVGSKSNGKVMISVGHSIINRSSTLDVGSLMLHYGGGGHQKVGTCQVPMEDADRILDEILGKIND